MKIALFTYFAADNYGATLQAYATIKALEANGYEVELVDYVIDEPERSIIKKILLYPKHLRFRKFRKKHFHALSQRYDSYESLVRNPPQADCYLVGSDQTWNADISKDKAKGYFLDFGDKDILRGSYSASIGKTVWEDTPWITKEEAQRGLDHFDFLSIRENSGVELLEKEFSKQASLVIDPVLLFSSYPELTGEIEETDEIITYKLINSDNFYEKVKMIASNLGVVCRSIGSIRQINGFKHSYPESIETWIRRIAGAKFVITDSFHGTVISILYHRQFIFSVGDPKRVTRIFSLLKLLGLESRYVPDTANLNEIEKVLQEPIDWAETDKILSDLRSHSFEFIKRIKYLKKNNEISNYNSYTNP